jgi:predicted PurR-regulated permease PerM
VPDDLSSLRNSAVSTAQWLQSKGVAGAEDTVNKTFDTFDWNAVIGYARQADVRNVVASVLGTTVGAVATYLSEVTLVLILMIFILSEAHGTTSRALAARQAGGPDLTRLLSSASEIQKYLGMKTIISAMAGLLAGIWCWIFDLEYPVLWGLLAFALHFIPAVGALVAGVLPCLVALVKHGPGDAAAIAVGFAAINFMIGNFVEPTLMGRRFGVSSLVVVLSVWFWSWMWGAVGAFLAVPLTIMIKVALEHSTEFRWISVAMSKKQVKKGEVIILESPHPDESDILGAGAATEPPH